MPKIKSWMMAGVLAMGLDAHAPTTISQTHYSAHEKDQTPVDNLEIKTTNSLIDTLSVADKRFDSQLLRDVQSAYRFGPKDKHLIDPYTRSVVGRLSFEELYDRQAKNFKELFPVQYEVVDGDTDTITLGTDGRTMYWRDVSRTVEHDTHQDVYDMARYILQKRGSNADLVKELPGVDGTSGLSRAYYRISNDSASHIAHLDDPVRELKNILRDNDSVTQDLSAAEIYASNYAGTTLDHVPPLDSFGEYDIQVVRTIFEKHGVDGLVKDIFSTGLVLQESAMDRHALSSVKAQSYRQMMRGFQSMATKRYSLDEIDMTSLESQAQYMALHLQNIEHGIRCGELLTPLSDLMIMHISKLHQSYTRLHQYRDWIDSELLMAWIMTSNHHNGAIGTDAAIDSLLWQIEKGHIDSTAISSTMELIEYITMSQWARNTDRENQQAERRDYYTAKHNLSNKETIDRKKTAVIIRQKESALYFWKTLGLTLMHDELTGNK